MSSSKFHELLFLDQAEILSQVKELVRRALEEDLGGGDRTSSLTVPPNFLARGKFFAKQELVVAGLPVAQLVFRLVYPLLQ